MQIAPAAPMPLATARTIVDRARNDFPPLSVAQRHRGRGLLCGRTIIGVHPAQFDHRDSSCGAPLIQRERWVGGDQLRPDPGRLRRTEYPRLVAAAITGGFDYHLGISEEMKYQLGGASRPANEAAM